MGHNSTKWFWIVAPSLAAALTLAVSSDWGWLAPERAEAASGLYGMSGNNEDFVKDSFVKSGAEATATVVAAKSIASARSTTTAGGIKPSGDYISDKWNPIHFKPMIDTASNE
jgi:hypothetical protein